MARMIEGSHQGNRGPKCRRTQIANSPIERTPATTNIIRPPKLLSPQSNMPPAAT